MRSFEKFQSFYCKSYAEDNRSSDMNKLLYNQVYIYNSVAARTLAFLNQKSFKYSAMEKDVCYTPQQYLGLLADKFPCILNLEGSL